MHGIRRKLGHFPHASAGVRAAVAITLLLLAFAGCGKKHRVLRPVSGPRYPVLSSPANVLAALAIAYSSRDSVEYKLLFHDNYQGSSLDQGNPLPQLLTYTKADEARHIAALAKSTTVSSVDLQLVPMLYRFTDMGDLPGWATISNPVFRLSIFDGPETYEIIPSEELMEFKFIPRTPDSTSPTDTTWKIIRWTEVRQ